MNEGRYVFMKEQVADVRKSMIESDVITCQQWIDKHNKLDEYIDWCRVNDRVYDLRLAEHAKYKYSINKGIWDGSLHYFGEVFNAYIGRNAADAIHPTEERSLNLREGMHMMGMPHDFVIPNGMKDHAKLPQNVPTCTARDMTLECIKFINGELEDSGLSLMRQNNENETMMTTPKTACLSEFF
jgi:hypothetical protein